MLYFGRLESACRLGAALFVVNALALLTGCSQSGPTTPELPAPIVTVAAPTARPVTRNEFFTGRTEGTQKIDVRSRVSGYLIKILFKPGAEVTKGTPLFEIDPEPFKAALAKSEAELAQAEAAVPLAQAQVERSEAKVVTATADFKRIERAFAAKGASQDEFDKSRGARLEAEATVKADKATVEANKAQADAARATVRSDKLNLSYCSIRAEIDGVMGDTLITEQNLISGGTGSATILTTIITVDPMFVTFDVDEHTLQRIQRAIRDGALKLEKAGEIPIEAGLAVDGDTYPLKGMITFLNNTVDPKTGTIRMKARLDNPKSAAGPRALTPGMYTRVRVPIGQPVPSLLVPESAIGSDQGTKFLFTVGPENKALRLDANLGVLENGLRVIESARGPGDSSPRPLRADEQIIVTGLQRVRPGMVVDPKPSVTK